MAVDTRLAVPGVSSQTLSLAFHEISTLLHAGVGIDKALEGASHTGPPHFRRALNDLATQTRRGEELAGSMAAYRTMFNPMIPAIVAVGETTGNYEHSFAILAEYFESETELKRTLQNAMIYPTIVAVTALLAVLILSYIGFMDNHWAVWLGWSFAVAIGLWIMLRFRGIQKIARYIAMLIPFFGNIIQQLSVARFCHAFGMLIRAGVPYLEALEMSKPVVMHPLIERSVSFVYFGVRNGNSVEESIRRQPGFPAIVHNLVGSGEMAGSLDTALLKAAKYLRDDAEYKVKNAAKFAGPVMVIGMGVVVLLILLSFWGSYIDNIMSVLEE